MLRIRFSATLLLLALFLPAGSLAQTHASGALADQISAVLAEPALAPGFAGVLVRSLKDGRTLYSYNGEKVFLPASNNKILTSAAALDAMGPNYTYHTGIYYTGVLGDSGDLRGDLILKGSGDPVLTGADLQELARQAYAAGLRHVDGGLFYDDTLFGPQRLGETWAWDDESYYYSAQISALNVDENVLRLTPSPGKSAGARIRLSQAPLPHFARIDNEATTGPSGSKPSLEFSRVRGRNILLVTGALPLGASAQAMHPVPLTLEHPSLRAAELMQQDLMRAGVSISGVPRARKTPQDAPLLCEHVSPPLSVILRRMNKVSDNFIAECLLRTVGAIKTGQGTADAWGTAAQSARKFFASIGVDMSELRQADGSGLSRTNFVSPKNIVQILSYLHNQPYFPVFYDSLPIGGHASLSFRMKGTAAADNCHAKTGYVSQVSSISGYVTDRTGEMLVFSILMNNELCGNRPCTLAQDHIVELLADYAIAAPQVSARR